MTLKKRRILFFISAVIFLLFSPIIIFFASGYKYNWEKNCWLKTGSFYFRIYPSDVEILINGQKKGVTNDSVSYLLPGKYQVELKKYGYQEWRKNMMIKPELITEVSGLVLPLNKIKIFPVEKFNALLEESNSSLFFQTSTKILYRRNKGQAEQYSIDPFPEDIAGCQFFSAGTYLAILSSQKNLYLLENKAFKKIAAGVQGVQFSSDGRKILWWNKNEIWIYCLADDFSQPFRAKGSKDLLVRLSQPIKQAIWLSPWDRQVFFLTDKKVGLSELDFRGGRNIFTLQFTPLISIQKIYWDKDGKYLYLLDQRGEWWRGKIW